MRDRERKRVPDDRSNALKKISPRGFSCTPLGYGKSENPRPNKRTKEYEATQRGMNELCKKHFGSR